MTDDLKAESVTTLIAWIDLKLSTSTSALYRERFGIGITERRILGQLHSENDISVTRLCQVIGNDKGTISRAVGHLEKLGLVEIHVNSRDNRIRLVGMTRRGRALLMRIEALATKRHEFLLSIFSPEERATMVALLRRLHEHVPAATRFRSDNEGGWRAAPEQQSDV